MTHPPYRERRVLFPLGVFVGFCLAMLIDAILHTALYHPPAGARVEPLHEMTADAWSDPVRIPRDTFDISPPPPP